MKKSHFVLAILLYTLCFSGTVLASVSKERRGFETYEVPLSFTAYGMQYKQNIAPFHRLQNTMKFHFISGEEIHEQFRIEYKEGDPDGYGPSEHIVDFYLTYDSEASGGGNQYLISGTFQYYHEFSGTIKEYEGKVSGGFVDSVAYEDMEFDESNEVIMLSLDVVNASWDWDIYLYVADESFLGKQTTGLPLSSNQADVAVGVAVSTMGITLLNILTKTSVTGLVSMNTASSAVYNTGIEAASEEPENFIVRLLRSLKDMFVDEGRSYASGKTADIIKNLEK